MTSLPVKPLLGLLRSIELYDTNSHLSSIDNSNASTLRLRKRLEIGTLVTVRTGP